MSLKGILRYTGHALGFAVIVCGVWLLVRLARGKRFGRGDVPRLVFVGYLAAVAEIIALRVGLHTPRWLGGLSGLNLVPLSTTAQEWRQGAWPFIYHVAGNLMWFVPLGVLLPLLRPGCGPWRALLAGALLSLAAEALQLLLGTGMPDIDDVLLNAAGAPLGYALFWIAKERRHGTEV